MNKPEIKLMPASMVELAKASGMAYLVAHYQDRAAILGTGIPAEFLSALEIAQVKVTFEAEKDLIHVEIRSMGCHGQAQVQVGESGHSAMVKTVRFCIGLLQLKDSNGWSRWPRRKLDAALVALGETP